jgi:hypothetical protein
MSLYIEKPVRFVWLIANTEAYLAGEERIRPLHFFLALLKAADPRLGLQLVESGINQDEQMKLAKDGKDICRYLELTPSEAKTLRRSIRKKIRPQDRSISGMQFLHRTPESRQLFRVAAQRAAAKGETALSSPRLLESLFSTGMIAFDSEGQLVYGEG